MRGLVAGSQPRFAAMGCGLAALAIGLLPIDAHAQLKSQVVTTGLSSPVALVPDPAFRNVLYVVEQGGLVRVLRDERPRGHAVRRPARADGRRAASAACSGWPLRPTRPAACSSTTPISTATRSCRATRGRR